MRGCHVLKPDRKNSFLSLKELLHQRRVAFGLDPSTLRGGLRKTDDDKVRIAQTAFSGSRNRLAYEGAHLHQATARGRRHATHSRSGELPLCRRWHGRERCGPRHDDIAARRAPLRERGRAGAEMPHNAARTVRAPLSRTIPDISYSIANNGLGVEGDIRTPRRPVGPAVHGSYAVPLAGASR